MSDPGRGARHLERLRVEAIHDAQRRAIASAHRTLDKLKDEQDRLDALPWHSRPEGRAGQLVAAIADAEQRIVEMERLAETERVFNLDPQPFPAPVVPNGATRGLPPSWHLGPWPPAPPAAPRSRTRAAAPAARPVPPPKRLARSRGR